MEKMEKYEKQDLESIALIFLSQTCAVRLFVVWLIFFKKIFWINFLEMIREPFEG